MRSCPTRSRTPTIAPGSGENVVGTIHMSWAESVAGPRAMATISTPRHLLKRMSVQVKQVFAGSALEAVLAAAAKRPPSNEDSPLPPVGRFLGGFRRSFVTGRRNIDELNGCDITDLLVSIRSRWFGIEDPSIPNPL